MKIWTNVKKWLPVMLILALLCGLIGSTYAKYVKQQTLEGTVTIKANLGKIELREHKAVRQEDGSYTLDKNSEVVANSYILLPGLDIPKDPFVRITDKTPIEAYVFVEVVSGLAGSAVTFEVDVYDADSNPNGNWIKLSGVTGKNGGTVYVYKETVTSDIGPIHILKGNTVTVGQKLLHGKMNDLDLKFYACMGQTAAGADAAEVYNALFAPKID